MNPSKASEEVYQLHWYADSFMKWEQGISHHRFVHYLVSHFGIETLFLLSDLCAFIELVFDFDYVTKEFCLVERPTILQTVRIRRLKQDKREIHSVAKKNSSDFLPIKVILKSSKISGLKRVKTLIVNDPHDVHWKGSARSLFPRGHSVSVPTDFNLKKFASKLEQSEVFQHFCILALRAHSADNLCDSHFIIIKCFSGIRLNVIKAVVSFDIHPVEYIKDIGRRMYFPIGYKNVMKTFTKERSSRFKKFMIQHADERCGMMRMVVVNENNLAHPMSIPILLIKSSFKTVACDYGMEISNSFRKLQQMRLYV